jgi:hypothetical protein
VEPEVRLQLFALVLAIAAFNGIFSPLVHLVAAYSFVWAPPWLSTDPSVTFYFSSLILATTTLLVSGVLPALLERAVPASHAAPGPNLAWAATALVLTLPAVIRLLLISGVAQ